MKSNLLKAYDGFKLGFAFDKGFANIGLKLLSIIVIGHAYISLFISLCIVLILNYWTGRLMDISVHVFIDINKGFDGTKKLVILLLIGPILGSFIFALYIAVIVYRIVFRILHLFYAIGFMIITLFNSENITSNMGECIKENQSFDVF